MSIFRKISLSSGVLSLLTFFLPPCCVPLYAAAWVQPEGETYISLALSEYQSGWFWDEEGDRKKSGDGTYRKREIKLYMEHGLTEETTLIFALPWQRAEKLEPSDLSEQDFHDVEIGIRRRLWARGFETASWQLLLGVPSGYTTDSPFRLGDGNTYLDLRYLWGWSYEEQKDRYGYVSLEGGVRHFLEGNEVDQFRFDGTWFHPTSSKLGFQATLSAIQGFSISTAPGRNGFSLFKGGAGIVYSLSSATEIMLRNTWDLTGKNTGDGSNLELVFSTRFGR